jgi:two-component system sensor histidine kinase UhpB
MNGLPRLTLLGRIVLANVVVIVTAAALLVVTPYGISYPAATGELLVLAVAIVVMVALDAVLVRRALMPVEHLRESMRRIDPLEPGERLRTEHITGEVAELAHAFNEMADRLEAERRESARRTLAGREQERRMVARELHDEVGQTLTALLAQLDRVGRRAPEDVRSDLGEAQEAARASLADVRRVVTRLRPDTLEDLGLASALRALTRRVSERTGLPVRYRIDPYLPPLGEEAELVVYRVAQEALTNIVRHAGASQIELALTCDDDGVTLVVRDDGRGLNGNAPASGIRGMRERALLVGGRLRVGDRPQGGVEARLDIPILEAHR